MEKAVFEYLVKVLEPNTMVTLVALYLVYKIIMKLEGGVRAGLLSHLTRIHSGATDKGSISKDALRIAEECYKQYHSLGGDGYADNIMGEIRALPIK